MVTFNMRFPGETLSVHCQNVSAKAISKICIDFIHSAICSYVEYPQVPIVLVFFLQFKSLQWEIIGLNINRCLVCCAKYDIPCTLSCSVSHRNISDCLYFLCF